MQTWHVAVAVALQLQSPAVLLLHHMVARAGRAGVLSLAGARVCCVLLCVLCWSRIPAQLLQRTVQLVELNQIRLSGEELVQSNCPVAGCVDSSAWCVPWVIYHSLLRMCTTPSATSGIENGTWHIQGVMRWEADNAGRMLSQIEDLDGVCWCVFVVRCQISLELQLSRVPKCRGAGVCGGGVLCVCVRVCAPRGVCTPQHTHTPVAAATSVGCGAAQHMCQVGSSVCVCL